MHVGHSTQDEIRMSTDAALCVTLEHAQVAAPVEMPRGQADAVRGLTSGHDGQCDEAWGLRLKKKKKMQTVR